MLPLLSYVYCCITDTCYGTIDLILVVDASYSISDADFEVICKLSTSIFESVHADAGSKLRAGFIMYASTVYENDVMNLNAYNYNTFVTKVKGVTRVSLLYMDNSYNII